MSLLQSMRTYVRARHYRALMDFHGRQLVRRQAVPAEIGGAVLETPDDQVVQQVAYVKPLLPPVPEAVRIVEAFFAAVVEEATTRVAVSKKQLHFWLEQRGAAVAVLGDLRDDEHLKEREAEQAADRDARQLIEQQIEARGLQSVVNDELTRLRTEARTAARRVAAWVAAALGTMFMETLLCKEAILDLLPRTDLLAQMSAWGFAVAGVLGLAGCVHLGDVPRLRRRSDGPDGAVPIRAGTPSGWRLLALAVAGAIAFLRAEYLAQDLGLRTTLFSLGVIGLIALAYVADHAWTAARTNAERQCHLAAEIGRGAAARSRLAARQGGLAGTLRLHTREQDRDEARRRLLRAEADRDRREAERNIRRLIESAAASVMGDRTVRRVLWVSAVKLAELEAHPGSGPSLPESRPTGVVVPPVDVTPNGMHALPDGRNRG